MGIAIVTDSTCDLGSDILRRYAISVIPLSVGFGEHYYLDRVEISTEAFMERLVTSRDPVHTAAPSIGAMASLYRELLAKPGCDAILSIHLSGGLSSTVRVAESAARLVEADIMVIDSQNVSIGLGMLVWWAARRAREGMPERTIVEEIQSLIPQLHLLVAPVTLEYLARGGRIGQAARWVGTLLDMKPILEVEHGMIKAAKKVRGERHITPALLQRFEEWVAPGTPSLLAVASTTPVSHVESLRKELSSIYPPVGWLTAIVGPVIATHAGPGAFGALVCPLTPEQVLWWQHGETDGY